MSPILAAALAAALLSAGPATPPPAKAPPPRAPNTAAPKPSAEATLLQCWARDVEAPCTPQRSGGDEAEVEACKTERAKTACVAEREAYEKDLAAGLAGDAIELMSASIRKVCTAEAAARSGGKLSPEQESAIAIGWREALDVRSEFMKACERSGRDARECDERATDAERKALAEGCPTAK